MVMGMKRTCTFGKRAAAVVVAGAALLVPLGKAAAAESAKIGYVEIPYLIDKSPQSQEASAKLKKQFAPKKRKLQKKRKELQKIKKKLQKESLTLSESKRNQLEGKAKRLQRELKRSKKALQQELNIQRNDAFKGVRQSVMKAVKAVAEKQGYDLVVGQGALYASNAVDITDQVLQRMKQRYQQKNSQ